MFSKNNELLQSRSGSILGKLALLYALITFCLLFSIGLILYPSLSQNIHHNISIVDYFIQLCFRNLIFTLILCAVGSLVLGYYIAKNGLRRLFEFSSKMDNITIHSLNERINLHEWPAELHKLADKYNLMLDRLETSFIQLSQFSSDIAHELRSPLHNMRLTTEFALAHHKTDHDYKKILESNQEEYEQLSGLIDTLLFLAQSDHGQINLRKTTFQTTDEITKVIEFYKALSDEKNIRVTHEGNALLYADKTLFSRIISNLVSNSLKYTKEGGFVSIKTEELICNSTQISIHDSGIGIPEENISKLFDRFYRVDSSRSFAVGGHGLGLAIVQSILKLHQGTIQIESKINTGTTVTIVIPNIPG
ncbi:MAG: heavy metal sensor histidine kinase [Gammaproteobacteria bacterium]|nr:heavy metal sensor histidine kinase [Gammaproteobacteria bacterium]